MLVLVQYIFRNLIVKSLLQRSFEITSSERSEKVLVLKTVLRTYCKSSFKYFTAENIVGRFKAKGVSRVDDFFN